jgi:polysaccharide biosynthesis transport protein
MDSPKQRPAVNGRRPASSGMGVDDILYTLFRHKRLILVSCCLGVLGAVVVRIMRPPPFVSTAKLMVHYVVEARGGATAGSQGENVRPLDFGGMAILSSEIEILTSLDVAKQVVAMVGADKILAKKGGGNDPMTAAVVVCDGIDTVPPHSSTIAISFRHPDPNIVQPVLDALIHSYMLKHAQVHVGVGELADYYANQEDELRAKLTRTEMELKRLKSKAQILNVEDSKHSYQTQISKVENELSDAELEQSELQAALGHSGQGARVGSATNATDMVVPQERLSEYGDIASELDSLKREEHTLLRTYTESNPVVLNVHGRMRRLQAQKTELERAFPALTRLAPAGGLASTNAVGGDLVSQMVRMTMLDARVAKLGSMLTNLQAEAGRIMDLEPELAALERLRGEQQKAYELLVAGAEQTAKGGSLAGGNVINMSVVEHPTPPGRYYKKLLKMVGAVFGGCIGLGVGLAFLFDLMLDRSIKRAVDVERQLQIPVWLTIPDTAWSGSLRLSWLAKLLGKRARKGTENSDEGAASEQTALAPWDPRYHLQVYAEGLRERVMTFFEVNKLETKKPKLVAVTACGHGGGVSTLASGLAAELSKTGDGNVLLVNVNGEEGAAHSFHRGKPGCGVAEALEPDARAGAMVQERLYVASLEESTGTEMAMILPKRFNHLVPRLKASDYDYIIFDMPPVSPTSATPRLASHMDVVLLVLESEKTGQHSAARATALMRDSHSNVAAVLNKYRAHVPEKLSPDA